MNENSYDWLKSTHKGNMVDELNSYTILWKSCIIRNRFLNRSFEIDLFLISDILYCISTI